MSRDGSPAGADQGSKEIVRDEEADAILFDLLGTDAGRADPYPRYRVLRERWPRLCTGVGMIVLSTYADVEAVLRDPRLGRGGRVARRGELSGAPVTRVSEATGGALGERMVTTMLMADPPEHTRLRRIVSRSFTPQRTEALRDRVRAIADGLLRDLDGDVEMVRSFALPLPVLVISELLGVPPADRLGLQPLVRAVARTLEPLLDEATMAEAMAARAELSEYFLDQIRDRERTERPDLLSALVHDARAREGTPEALSDDEVVGTAILLFAAGFETTTNLIGNGLLALLRAPRELERWRRDPAISKRAVEELLRFESPVQINARQPLDDVEVAGMALQKGQVVLALVGAANRDPARFDDPDRLDLNRDEGSHLSFGLGIHHCLGAPLARVEGEEAFGRLLETFSVIELDGEPEWRSSITLRGLDELPVHLGRSG